MTAQAQELLRLAAKAMGKLVCASGATTGEGILIGRGDGDLVNWNPLADDAEAFRIAATLRFKVTIGWDNPTLVTVEWIEYSSDGTWHVKEIESAWEDNVYAAARHAVVEAAAIIGGGMP